MEYITSYYRQQGGSGCSLLLLQFQCRQTPVCFACICTAAGADGEKCCGDMAEKLKAWCRGVPWQKSVRRPCKGLENMEQELTALQAAACGAASLRSGLRLTMLLCIGREVLSLGAGQNLLLINTSLGTGRITPLPGTFRGCIEPGAGLLLATDGLIENAGEESIGEVLRLSEIRTQEQADRRLRELLRFRELLTFRESVISEGETAIRDQAAVGKKTVKSREPDAAILLIGREGKAGVSRQQGKV